MTDKEKVYWMLHRAKEDIPEETLSQYPDLQEVDRQIKRVTDSITINGYAAQIDGRTFDIRDFPMDNRVAQREFARVSGITCEDISDVKIGKRQWDVFHATEMIVIGIQKRLKDVLGDKHNAYRDWHYLELRDGDIVTYEGKETTVGWHPGAHLMKYDTKFNPLLPSKVEFQIQLF